MARICGFNWVALLLALTGFIQTTIIIVSGTASGVLPDNYLIYINISSLNIPAKLSSSTFLHDLSTITGTDFVGSDSTRESLGLARTYTVSLLTACSDDGDGPSGFTSPKAGYWFNPGKDLKLDSIATSGIQSLEYTSHIESYEKASYYIAVAYLAAECTLFLCIVLNLVSGCFPSTVPWSEVFACIATIWLFTATIVSVVKFSQLRDTFIANLGGTGLQATLGRRVYILSFISFAESLLATIALAVQSACSKSRKPQRILGRGSNLQDPTKGPGAAKGPPETAFVKPGFMMRVTTWSRHEYTQVGKQPVIIHRQTVGPDEDHQDLVAAVEGDDFSHEYSDDIVMGDMPPARNSSRDRDRKNQSTVYDPYTAPQTSHG
ncbi:hypothetical protein SCAR479_06612 [Seiridium cardinale]|uniref:Uncharacterized protein n=1 Tax=Seiridium cardinale TaxID=138064 RepID=A0ABR2XT77_9PEZI